ncbi:MAG: leucine-rich repeat protein [Prevotellaceae bacterium]|nr:leucine-rich repeat protein [Prevotellaceae bacterium]
MNYPLISEYIDAILNAEDNFATLTSLRPVLGGDGRPFMSSGNFAVVFKMTDGRNNYAVKCFTKEQEGREENYRLITQELECVGSKYLLNVEYLEDELFVDTRQSDRETFPVLKMQWAEGVTLDRYIKERLSDDYALQMLAYEFSRMGMWLMNQEFAHGDLKPDNILVRNDGTLVLVDYDGMFVPAMQGQRASELGTPDFRHPLRTAEQFDARIDDFSIAAIALSLKAIAARPSLWADYHSQDRLLLGYGDYVTPGASPLLREVLSLSNDAALSRLFGLFMIALSSQKLSLTSFRLLEVGKPERKKLEILPTKVSREEIADGIEDEFGVVYSRDGKRLLRCYNENITRYDVKEGTVSICDGAFGCLFEDLIYDRFCMYTHCKSLKSITIPDSVTNIGCCAFGCSSLESITIPNSVMRIEDNAFNWTPLKSITIPNSVTRIEDFAFWCCSSLESLTLPNSITYIGNNAFDGCTSLKSIYIPASVENIGTGAFGGSSELMDICSQLNSIVVDRLNPIYDSRDCNIIVETKSNTLICGCQKSIIPNSVTCIGDKAFCGCSFKSITIPDSVTCIGNSAFWGCDSLESVTIPDSVTSIGDYAFSCCSSLESINIPIGTRSKFERLLPDYKHLLVEKQF